MRGAVPDTMKERMNCVVVGTQWGDEGKGKIVDLLAEKADGVIRYQGGHNAGHTVIVGNKEIVLHLIPTGILHPEKMAVIGNGVVIDPKAFLEEVASLASRGISVVGRLFISELAHLIMPYHTVLDQEGEKQSGRRRIGTTGRGIGPAYADKMARIGIRVIDLFDPDIFRQKIEQNLAEINIFLKEVYHTSGLDIEAIYREYIGYRPLLKPYVTDTSQLIHRAIRLKKNLLFEGAQGTHLDVDLGTYPYVTSSHAAAGGACTGTGVGPTQIDHVLGVTKAYTTRVGEGPFPSELQNEQGRLLREKGHEFGATTGRPRRCGWFDAVSVRYAVRVNNLDALAVTKLDVLDGQTDIDICVAYECEGQLYNEMPASLRILQSCTPRFIRLPGWTETTMGMSSFESLPKNAKAYLDVISNQVGCPIDMISTGSRREETIVIKHPFG